MDDDLRELFAEELRSVASEMLKALGRPRPDVDALELLRERVLDVAFRLDPRDEKQRHEAQLFDLRVEDLTPPDTAEG